MRFHGGALLFPEAAGPSIATWKGRVLGVVEYARHTFAANFFVHIATL